jgi:pyrimidine deaminase RibD-like protein
MREPIFRAENRAAMRNIADIAPDAESRARDRALLWRATTLAIESAFRYGRDFPVGAVAANGNEIVGRYYASDKRLGIDQLHAERMAVLDAMVDRTVDHPDTVVVTLEPCKKCQDFLASVPSIKRVGFSLTRAQVAAKGLVKSHDETIFGRALRNGAPFEIVHIEDEQLARANEAILDHVSRDPKTEEVQVDTEGLHSALVELNES